MDSLQRMLDGLSYRDWRFVLEGAAYPRETLVVLLREPDSNGGPRMIAVRHRFALPREDLGPAGWRRWLFDRILQVELHEAMERFRLDGERPFMPEHGLLSDPYVIVDKTP